MAAAATRKIMMGRNLNGATPFWATFASGNCDYTIDSVSLKRLTLNAALTAALNNTITHKFVLPASPVAGQEIHVLYRIAAAGEEFLNCWDLYLRRNDANNAWSVRLDRISAGTRTNLPGATVADVGNPDALRIVTSGNDHTVYTGAADTYTQRGTTQTNSTHNTATGLNTVASSGFTQTSLEYTA